MKIKEYCWLQLSVSGVSLTKNEHIMIHSVIISNNGLQDEHVSIDLKDYLIF